MTASKLGALALAAAFVTAIPHSGFAQIGREDTIEARKSPLHIGFSAGPEITRLNFKLKDGTKPAADAKIGFHVGIAVGFDFGKLTLRSGMNFVNAGALFDGAEAFSRSELNVSFLTLPIDVRYRPLGRRVISPYIFVGPEFRYSLNLEKRPIRLDEDLRLLNATFAAGAGVSVRIPGVPFRFSPEVRYVSDMSGFYSGDLETDDGDFVETAGSVKANAVRVGLLFGF